MLAFSMEAPKYWAAKLPAIPLQRGQKRPAIARWQNYAESFPTDDERDAWLRTYPDGNIGLPMGPAANLVAIDIDTDDPEIIAALDRLLPSTPWERVGAKGKVKIYRYSGERTTRIRTNSGAVICEILSKGTQIVLPPSIHPDTNLPYVANSNLYEVVDAVPVLPAGTEARIRQALADLGIDLARAGSGFEVTKFVPVGARDNAMVVHAGILSRAVVRGERTLLEVLGEMDHWVATYVEQVIGDPLSPHKAQQKIIEFLIRDVSGGKALPIGWDTGLSNEDKQKLGLGFSEVDEVWDTQRTLTFLKDRRVHTEGEEWHAAIRFAFDRMASAGTTIDEMGQQQIFSFISGQTPGFTVASLKRQFRGQSAKDKPLGDTHSAIAELLLGYVLPQGEVCFDAGSFWQWKGANWEELGRPFLLKTISEEFGHLEGAKRQSDHSGALRVLEARLNQPLSTLRGLNFANGFLTEDGVLREHRPSDGCTYVLPYCYNAEEAGHMPLFSQFLMDSWGADPDYEQKVAALQEAIGVTLFGRATSFQRAFLLYGVANGGKSVLRELVESLVPSSAMSAIPPQDWGDRFLPAEMHGKLINSAGELSETARIQGDTFKQIVSGETIHAQRKYQQPFAFKPICAQWFSANHLPMTGDTSAGFSRRWLILEFENTVPPERRVEDFSKVIYAEEREAIVAWAVEGFARRCGQPAYTLPASHFRLVEAMSNRNSPVRLFLTKSDRIKLGKPHPANFIRIDVLYNLYMLFCAQHRIAARKNMAEFYDEISLLKEQFDFVVVPGTGVKDTVCEGITVHQ